MPEENSKIVGDFDLRWNPCCRSMTIGAVNRITVIILLRFFREQREKRADRTQTIFLFARSIVSTRVPRRLPKNVAKWNNCEIPTAVGGKFYQRLLGHRSTKIRYPAVIVKLWSTNYYISRRGFSRARQRQRRRRRTINLVRNDVISRSFIK